jgi:hypothetical protein
MRVRNAIILAGLLGLGACEQTPAEKRADSPYYRPPTPAEASCDREGFVRGTNGYDECLQRYNGVVKPPPAVTPPAGVEVFKDEYGNRYDGQGNRLDAQGNIIAPPVSRP